MTKKSIPYSNLKRLSILGLICVLLLSLMVFAACEEEEEEAYTLIIAVSPAGSGTTSPAAGTYVYDEGDVVTITATAASGYDFVNWSGAASGTSTTTSVTMTSNKTVTANFETEIPAVTEYTLTMAVTPTGGGTTTPAVGTHTYDEGDVVAVTATAATGYEFVSWSTNVVDGDVTMDADKTVTATFALIPTYALTVTVDPTDSGSVTLAPATGPYEEGTTVTLTAVPASGYAFVGWSGDATGTTTTATVTMDAAKTVTATFAQIMWDLTMAKVGTGTVEPDVGDHTYAEGTVVNIEASPEANFVSWTGDVADANDPATTVTMDAAKTVTANFTNVTYTLTMAVDDPARGSTTPAVAAHTYAEGRVVTIAATAATGWQFDSWTGDVVDGTVTMNADKTVTANFVEYTGPAVPGVGSEWVYEVTYGAETTVWTVTVTGEETINSVDCYKTETAYDPAPARVSAGNPVTIAAATYYMSKATFYPVNWGGTPPGETAYSTMAAINLFDLEVATYMTNDYTGGHGWDLSVNTAWTYDQAGVLVPPLSTMPANTHEVAVTGTQDVTVPAGTFSCYVIEDTVVAKDGVPVTPYLSKVEYWCPEVSGVVKVESLTMYEDVETQVLTDHTLL